MKLSFPEFVFILLFCLSYAFVANVQSRMFPTHDSMAETVRGRVWVKVMMLNEKYMCEEKGASSNPENTNAIIWYHNKDEYWCGLLALDNLSKERLDELKPYITVLNTSDRKRRVVDAGN